ncbi:MAG: Fic family protein [Actinomycetota bacterium]
MSLAWVDLAEYLTVAGAVLGIDPAALVRYANLSLAESALAAPAASFGGTEFYPEFHLKVAVLGWHLIRNHPLPDGNKRAGFLTMVEFVERNDFQWDPRLAIPKPTEMRRSR